MSDVSGAERVKPSGGGIDRPRLGPVSWDRAAPALLCIMVLAVLGDIVLSFGRTIVSHQVGDATRYFVFVRDFGYDELRHGNLALWNPHTYSGTPFVGLFQPAMFYPLNLVHLLLPTPVGINLEIAFHVLLLGLGTLAWARGRGLSAPAALTTASVTVFGAAVSLRVLAGALSVLATYAWVPLLLCCVDRLSRKATPGWTLVAGLATTMTLLAGHPPTAFMSAAAVGLYCVPALLASTERWRFAGSLAAAGLASLLLSGAQLATGFEVARESIREGGVPFDFATSYSFPPENLLTLTVPYLFGSATPHNVTYFGRWWYWDDSAFIGVTAFVLAIIGAAWSRAEGRRTAITLSLVFVVMALGRYTPAYAFLFRFVPGFDLFRAPSKFMFFASLFIALLAGMGMDRLLRKRASDHEPRRPSRRRLAVVLAGVGALTVAAGLWTGSSAESAAGGPSLVRTLSALNEARRFFPGELATWGGIAAPSIEIAGLTCLVLGVLFWISQTQRWATWLIMIVCLVELVTFARQNRGGVPFDATIALRTVSASLYARAGTRRVLQLGRANNFAMVVRGYSLWGYDPLVLGRYAEFMARTQGRSPEELNNVGGKHPNRFHPLLGMLRGHYSLSWVPREKRMKISEHPGELPRFVFVGRYTVRSGVEEVLDYMDDEQFDPGEVVVLESEPDPRPAGGPVRGEVAVLEESTDDMVLDVRVDAPAILVVTDSYARGWRAVALAGSSQQSYRVQPANLVLRGIALAAGRHRLRLEYAPEAYRAGQAASLLGGLVAVAGVAWWWHRTRVARRAAREDGRGDGSTPGSI